MKQQPSGQCLVFNRRPPTNLLEYQKKRFTKFAFRKGLILKGALFVVAGLELPGKLFARKKSGEQAPALRDAVIYRVKYMVFHGEVDRKRDAMLVDPVVGAGGWFLLVFVDVDLEALASTFVLPIGDRIANVI